MKRPNITPESLLYALESGSLEWSDLTTNQKDAVHALCVKLENQKQGYGGGNNP